MIELDKSPTFQPAEPTSLPMDDSREWHELTRWIQKLYTTLTKPLELKKPVQEVTATTTLRRMDDGLVLCDATNGAITLTLPNIDEVGDGLFMSFIKVDSTGNGITLDGVGSQTINGSATNTDIAAQFDRIQLVSTTDHDWLIISS